jgi:hypothetical protein
VKEQEATQAEWELKHEAVKRLMRMRLEKMQQERDNAAAATREVEEGWEQKMDVLRTKVG